MNRVLTATCGAIIAISLQAEASEASQVPNQVKEFTSGSWTYSVNQAGEATILLYLGKEVSVIFPSYIDGHPVRTIGGYQTENDTHQDVFTHQDIFFNRDKTRKVKRVTLPEGIVTIAGSSFNRCRELEEVNIPSTVKHIGDMAFTQTGIRKLTIPASVIKIGHFHQDPTEPQGTAYPEGLPSEDYVTCFWGSTKLEAIDVDPSNPFFVSVDGVLFNKDRTTLIAYPEARGRSYKVPASVRIIGEGAFRLVRSLTRVELPDKLRRIGRYSFDGCTGLSEIRLPSKLEHIEHMAFVECSNLDTVTIPNSVASVAQEAFFRCTNLKEVILENPQTSVGKNAFPPDCKVVSK